MRENEICELLKQENVSIDIIAKVRTLLVDESSEKTLGVQGRPADGPQPSLMVDQRNDLDDFLFNGETASDGSDLLTAFRTATLDRYVDLGILGRGGMGEVRKVYDSELKRTVAMKVIHPELMTQRHVLLRFIEEGQIGSQLQHPNIVPIYEMGRLDNDCLYFTMQEIVGEEFTTAISAVHDAIQNKRWRSTSAGWNFRRLIDVFQQVCSAISYSHSKGVVHRDLKPVNIMMGPFGKVFVVDWGIAKVFGAPQADAMHGSEDVVRSNRFEDGKHLTRVGQVAGTPSYMSPEQAKGRVDKIDARSDIYSLGAILFEILTGHAPAFPPNSPQSSNMTAPPSQDASETNAKVEKCLSNLDVTSYLRQLNGPPLPSVLVDACGQAMRSEPSERFQTVDELSSILLDWLDGAKSREQALKIVNKALETDQERERLLREASVLRLEAKKGLSGIESWESEDVKGSFWSLESRANKLNVQAEILSIRRNQLLKGALTHKSDLPEAHSELAKSYRLSHCQAEASRDFRSAVKSEIHLREHASALPEGHCDKVGHFAYLKGTGALSFVVDLDDAVVTLERYDLHCKRLVPTFLRSLPSQVSQLRLEMGSYRLRVERKGYHELFYPIYIGREEHWDSTPPAGTSSMPLFLMPNGRMTETDCFVHAGWFWSGGDSACAMSLPRRRLWMDGFIVRRFPITNREYLVFLNDLILGGQEDLALKWVPREIAGQKGRLGSIIYGRDSNGLFQLVPDADGDIWLPEQPVCMIDWFGAAAYAQWEAQRSGLPWRLPTSLEWEKAARGVDGRYYPWGDEFNPSYACMRQSHNGKFLPAGIDSYPIDESVYGVRGMAGNMVDWTHTVWQEKGPFIQGCRVIESADVQNDVASRVLKGGSWNLGASTLRAANRMVNAPGRRNSYYGFRLARSLTVDDYSSQS